MKRYVIVDGVLQLSSPETDRWARRIATHVPSAKSLTEATEAPTQRVLDPERHAAERAERTAYRTIETLEEQDVHTEGAQPDGNEG